MVTLFRHAKGGKIRTYRLRHVSEHNIQLWVLPAGRPPRKLLLLQREDDVEPVLKRADGPKCREMIADSSER